MGSECVFPYEIVCFCKKYKCINSIPTPSCAHVRIIGDIFYAKMDLFGFPEGSFKRNSIVFVRQQVKVPATEIVLLATEMKSIS